MKRWWLLWWVALSLASGQTAGGPALEWQRLLALDAGPSGRPASEAEARAASLGHLDRQEKALRSFLAKYPADEHAFEARLRLARALQIRAGLEHSDSARAEAGRLLEELSTTANPAQKVEVDFARLAFTMRSLTASDPAQRAALLAQARRFESDYPTDRRLAALLAEVATLFDLEPETKRALLVSAQNTATEPGLRRRIADDLKRLDLLGKPLSFRSVSRDGHAIDLDEYHGRVVILVFFARASAPSLEAVATLQRAALPKEKVQIVGVSLDRDSEVAGVSQQRAIAWPVVCDGKGWNGTLVRSLGINALPTVWLIDRAGTLKSLNGLQNLDAQVAGLLK